MLKKAKEFEELAKTNKGLFEFMVAEFFLKDYIMASNDILQGLDIEKNIAIRDYIAFLCRKIGHLIQYDVVEEKAKGAIIDKTKLKF